MDEPLTPEEKSNPPVESGPSPLKQIRTFQGDVASALENQKESLFSIQQTERLKRTSGGLVMEEAPAEDKGRKEFLLFILGGVLLLALGGLGAWFGYSEFVKRTAPPTIATPENRFISVQEEVTLNFASTTRETLPTLVSEQSLGTAATIIKHFVLRKGSWEGAPLVTTAELLQKLQSTAPGNLVRAFDPLFMLGAVGENRFILMRVTSFENAYPGMLTWEKTMPQDIGALFSNSESLKTIGSEPVFKDVISKNKDMRVLSSSGTTTEPLLLYSFFENKMLIITENLETMRVLVDRLTQELLSR